MDPVPRPVAPADLSVLIQLLAVLEGGLMVGDVDDRLAAHLRDRFVGVGLLEPEGGDRDFRQAINDLNHRLRYALNEYDDPPTPVPVP